MRVVDDWTNWADVNSLTVSDLALAPFVVEEISVDRHELCLEKVSELAAELIPPLSEVE